MAASSPEACELWFCGRCLSSGSAAPCGPPRVAQHLCMFHLLMFAYMFAYIFHINNLKPENVKASDRQVFKFTATFLFVLFLSQEFAM